MNVSIRSRFFGDMLLGDLEAPHLAGDLCEKAAGSNRVMREMPGLAARMWTRRRIPVVSDRAYDP